MLTKAAIEKYFNAEKNESLLFIAMGIVAIVLALIFFFYLATLYYKGAAIPLLVIGLLHLTVGITVYNRSDADRKRNVYAYDLNPAELKSKELPRMEKVQQQFVVLRYVEIALLVLGIGLFFYSRQNDQMAFLKGIGLALAIEALLTLALDGFAEKRAGDYTSGLISYTEQVH